ncbi:MAG TPA: STAS domain-containing protein [Candidatus Udaeobacter sp.]|nr:STAS domain-containing protein [Candidatus Udaeobacter sp.]
MGLKSVMHGPVAVLTPEGTLWGGDETNQLRDAIDELVKQGNMYLVLDLSKVNHLNSTALGLLVSTHTNYTKRGGSVKLCALEKRISNLLVITKLSMVFEVHETLEDALASFASRA